MVASCTMALIGSTLSIGCQSSGAGQQEASADSAGFVSIFDGTTLNGWEGDTAVWRVEDSAIVGEVTATSTPLQHNTFLTWRGGTPADFELTAEYRISPDGNSGIQYRSAVVDGLPDALKGYQMDIDGANTYTGQNYEERGRCIIAFRGQQVTLPIVSKPVHELAKGNVWSASVVTDTLADADSLKSLISSGWNNCRIVVNGNRLQHYINGVLMCDVTDDDTANRKADGLIGLQLHAGKLMKVEYRHIRLKQ